MQMELSMELSLIIAKNLELLTFFWNFVPIGIQSQKVDLNVFMENSLTSIKLSNWRFLRIVQLTVIMKSGGFFSNIYLMLYISFDTSLFVRDIQTFGQRFKLKPERLRNWWNYLRGLEKGKDKTLRCLLKHPHVSGSLMAVQFKPDFLSSDLCRLRLTATLKKWNRSSRF